MVTSIKGNDTSTFGGNIDVTGNVITDAPAFSCRISASQAISSSTNTKIALDRELFDVTNDFDNSTNYRFQPTIAGYYFISGCVLLANNINNAGSYTQIRKNGSSFMSGSGSASGAVYGGMSASGLIYLNGSTDYVELWIYQNAGSTINAINGVFAENDGTYMTGYLARAV